MNPQNAQPESPDEWIGQVVSNVRIEKLLSRGGMGSIYMGWHQGEERPVAVKIMKDAMRMDPRFQKRFQREAQAIADMEHPNIVNCLDCDVVQGRPYIIMELLEGMPLDRYLRVLHAQGLLLPLHIVLGLTVSLASALDYAHAAGILHLDVKPSNIILQSEVMSVDPARPVPPDLKAVLTDFGLAQMAARGRQTTAVDFMGTPAYASPELIRGERPDVRADVYSFGVVLYELLEGRPPFDPLTLTMAALLHSHLNDPPPEMRNTPPALAQTVRRALAKRPSERYPRAGVLAHAFERAVADLATGQGRPASAALTAVRPKAR